MLWVNTEMSFLERQQSGSGCELGLRNSWTPVFSAPPLQPDFEREWLIREISKVLKFYGWLAGDE